MVHPQMKAKDAESPYQILSMEDAQPHRVGIMQAIVDSPTLLSVNLPVALSPNMLVMMVTVE